MNSSVPNAFSMAFKRLRPAGGTAPSAPAAGAAGAPSTADLQKQLREQAAALASAPAPVAAAPVAAKIATPPPMPMTEAPPVSEPIVHTAEVMAPVAPAVAERGVSVGAFGVPSAKPAGISTVLAVAKAGGGLGPFPVVLVSAGNTGGAFAIANGVPAEFHAKLPQGKIGIQGMYLGSRYSVQAWPKGFEDREGEKEKPCWTCNIPITDAENVGLMTEAAKNYQFTPKAMKAKFDFEAAEVGHIRPLFQSLIYVPAFGDLIVVQSCAHYTAVERSSESLNAHIDPATGALNPFPCTVKIVTNSESNKAATQTWKTHHLDFHGEPNATGAEIVKSFNDWYKEAATDPELVAAFRDWTACTDDPLDADVLGALRKGKNL